MNFTDFLLRDNIVEIFLGTLIAFALTKFAESVEKNIFRPFVREHFRVTGQTKTGNVLSSLLGLVVVILLAYLSYRFIIKRRARQNTPLFQQQSKSSDSRLNSTNKQVTK